MDCEKGSDTQTPLEIFDIYSLVEDALFCLKMMLCFYAISYYSLSPSSRAKRKVNSALNLQVLEGKNGHFVTRTSVASPWERKDIFCC